MQDIFGKMAGNKRILAVADAIERADLLQSDELEGHYDPHIWFDVSLWSKTIDSLCVHCPKLIPKVPRTISATAMHIEKSSMRSMRGWRNRLKQIPIGQRCADYRTRCVRLLWTSLRNRSYGTAGNFDGCRIRRKRRNRIS